RCRAGRLVSHATTGTRAPSRSPPPRRLRRTPAAPPTSGARAAQPWHSRRHLTARRRRARTGDPPVPPGAGRYAPPMRALLVVNPNATTTSERSRSVLVRALRSEVTLDVAYTRARGHATALATDAVAAGFGLVVAHGGDGTVNEVVNGLMAAPVTDRPALAVVPGGSTNVFARALGLPADWGEAVGANLEALHDSRGRTVGLGLADGRYFTFCAGLGIDAAVVRRVERARSHGRTSSPALYVRATAGQLLVGANRSTLTVDAPDAKDEAFAAVIVQNTAPWTYLWGRPVHLSPEASFDRGLDVVALRRARS